VDGWGERKKEPKEERKKERGVWNFRVLINTLKVVLKP